MSEVQHGRKLTIATIQ